MPAIIIPKEKLAAYRRWEALDFTEGKKAELRMKEVSPEDEIPRDALPPEPEVAGEDAPPSSEKTMENPPSVSEALPLEETPLPEEGIEAPEKTTEVTSEEIPTALPTAADIERTYAEAHQQGYSTGYDEGIAAAKTVSAQIDALLLQLRVAIAQIDQRVADELLATSLKIAGQVVRQSLRVKPERLLPLVSEAIAALHPQHGAPTLILHPDDAKILRLHSDEMPECKEWRIVENVSIAPGGCRVELGAAEVDATLGTRWRRVVESIGLSEEWLDDTP